MTYRHKSRTCHHRVQNTQGSNDQQLRITCQECQGHLAIVYGRHLNVGSRRLIQEHLDETSPQGPTQPPTSLGNCTAVDARNALELWCKFYGRPERLKCDPEGCFMDNRFKTWLAARGIEASPEPGEAHWRLG